MPKPFPEDVCSNSVLHFVEVAEVSPHVYSVLWAGEELHIPYRIYAKESFLREASGAGGYPWIDALLTRHHNGFVREWALRALMTSGAPWAPAYVVPLVGEYVIEIVDLIDALLGEGDEQTYGAFLRENPKVLELTSQRVTSYWDCYWRCRYSRDEYVGFRVMKRLRAMAAATSP